MYSHTHFRERQDVEGGVGGGGGSGGFEQVNEHADKQLQKKKKNQGDYE